MLSKGEQAVLYMLEESYWSDRDCELEDLRYQVRELELEAKRRC